VRRRGGVSRHRLHLVVGGEGGAADARNLSQVDHMEIRIAILASCICSIIANSSKARSKELARNNWGISR
jgi:hypothetical protein